MIHIHNVYNGNCSVHAESGFHTERDREGERERKIERGKVCKG